MIATRKILIATPIKLGLTSSYMAGFVPTIQTAFPGVKLEHCVLEGNCVNFARNEIAHYARKIGAREIVFIDDDMGWTREHFARIISHVDYDVIGGLYCKRRPGAPFWLVNLKVGCEIDPATGIGEVEDVATGFMKIRVDTVLAKIAEKFPELEYQNQPVDGKPVTAFEFFPMGIVGPRTPKARLDKIKAVLAGYRTKEWDYDTAINNIISAVEEPHEAGVLRGEDYFFCHLARDCGFKIYADFGGEIIPHVGKVAFPITPDMVGLDPAAALKATGEKV